MLDDAVASDCIVWFDIPRADDAEELRGQTHAEAEAIPAVRVDGDLVRVTGIPFFPYHVGLGDEVTVREHEGVLYAVDVSRAAPVLTVRVFFTGSDDEAWWQMAQVLAPHRVWLEQLTMSYSALAIDTDEWPYVRMWLDARKRHGLLDWEHATPMRVGDG